MPAPFHPPRGPARSPCSASRPPPLAAMPKTTVLVANSEVRAHRLRRPQPRQPLGPGAAPTRRGRPSGQQCRHRHHHHLHRRRRRHAALPGRPEGRAVINSARPAPRHATRRRWHGPGHRPGLQRRQRPPRPARRVLRPGPAINYATGASTGLNAGAAKFVFVTQDGTINAWRSNTASGMLQKPSSSGTTRRWTTSWPQGLKARPGFNGVADDRWLDAQCPGAKKVADNRLFAADFAAGRVMTFDNQWNDITASTLSRGPPASRKSGTLQCPGAG